MGAKGQTDWRTDGQTVGQLDLYIDREKDCQKESVTWGRQTYRQLHSWTDEKWTYRQMNK